MQQFRLIKTGKQFFVTSVMGGGISPEEWGCSVLLHIQPHDSNSLYRIQRGFSSHELGSYELFVEYE